MGDLSVRVFCSIFATVHFKVVQRFNLYSESKYYIFSLLEQTNKAVTFCHFQHCSML